MNSRPFAALSASDRQEISAAILDFLDELEPLLWKGFGEEIAGSRAEGLAAHSWASTSQGPFPGRNALETVLFASLAGVDHARLFAVSLARVNATFSFATLARGAVEAYARSVWIIDSESDEEVVVRWLSALAAELKTHARIRPDGILHELRGRSSNAAQELERVLDDVENITGQRKPRTVEYTAMVVSLATRWKANGRIIYSDLSGVAHGESLGLHGFLVVDDAAGHYELDLHERWGLMYSQWVLSASSSGGRSVLEFLGLGVPDSHPCAQAHDRAMRCLATLRARVIHPD